LNKFGLIGYPLTHSFSEKYFSEKFARERISDCTYELFPLENIEDVRLLFEINKDLRGLNVTIPYKESIIQYLDDLDEVAEEISAVNCIKIDGVQKIGFNTDQAGFRNSLQPLLKTHHQKALILGTGGSSKSVAHALQTLGLGYQIVSRISQPNVITYAELNRELFNEFTVIINCTPVGMYPALGECPQIPYEYLTPNHLVYDLIYNPNETLFLSKAKAQGASIKNGLEMLQKQAELSWKIWNTIE
jgi:shikimate dehydrogenase